MNKWKDDEHRNRMHRRGIWRRVKASVRVLLAVAGWLILTLALFLAGMALLEDFSARARLLRLAGLYAATGGALVILHGLFFLLPTVLERRRSASGKRRSETYGRRRRAARRDPAAAREGMALVLVLIALALITALIVQTQIMARAMARHTDVRLTRGELLAAATDAARAAFQRLADDPDLLADTTNDTWAATEAVIRPDGVALLTKVVDEDRRFDINNLAVTDAAAAGRRPVDAIFDIFSLCGDFQTSGHLAALSDWVDADEEGLTEAMAYRKKEPPYAPPNRILYDWVESLSAEDGARARYQRRGERTTLNDYAARPLDCLTLLPVPRTRPLPINVNTASPLVLQGVLGIGQDTLVRAILTLRAVRPIRSFNMLGAVVEPGALEALLPYMDSKSHFFRVDTRASADGQEIRVQALARRDDAGRVTVVQWLF